MAHWIENFFFKSNDALSAWIPQPPLPKEKLQKLQFVAHRGNHQRTGCRENTVPAFEACRHRHIWAIEFDIHWTKDDIPVIHHDPHCGRLFEKPDLWIHKESFLSLRNQVPEIPRLDEVLQSFKEFHFFIELKTLLTAQQQNYLKNLFAEHSLVAQKNFHLLSLKTEFFEVITDFPPASFVCVAELDVAKLSQFAQTHHCGGLAGHYRLITGKYIQKHHKSDQKIGAGYICSKNSLLREAHRQVDWLFTNHVDTLSEIYEDLLEGE